MEAAVDGTAPPRGLGGHVVTRPEISITSPRSHRPFEPMTLRPAEDATPAVFAGPNCLLQVVNPCGDFMVAGGRQRLYAEVNAGWKSCIACGIAR